MIVAINYADDRFRPAQKLNTKTALKNGVDRVIEYSPRDIDSQFKETNKEIFSSTRGAGYWIWKPYIIKDAFSKIDEGDYLIYTDSGIAYVNSVHYLLNAMQKEKVDIMCFAGIYPEYRWTKRDAFILMECDEDYYKLSPQCAGGYIILRKSDKSGKIINDFLYYCCDTRIVSDSISTLDEEHPEFLENRHDQSIWSLLCKRNKIPLFRDPSQYGSGVNRQCFTNQINMRSKYPMVYIQYEFQLKIYQISIGCPKFWKYFSKIVCAIFHIDYIKNPYRNNLK